MLLAFTMSSPPATEDQPQPAPTYPEPPLRAPLCHLAFAQKQESRLLTGLTGLTQGTKRRRARAAITAFRVLHPHPQIRSPVVLVPAMDAVTEHLWNSQ